MSKPTRWRETLNVIINTCTNHTVEFTIQDVEELRNLISAQDIAYKKLLKAMEKVNRENDKLSNTIITAMLKPYPVSATTYKQY